MYTSHPKIVKTLLKPIGEQYPPETRIQKNRAQIAGDLVWVFWVPTVTGGPKKYYRTGWSWAELIHTHTLGLFKGFYP